MRQVQRLNSGGTGKHNTSDQVMRTDNSKGQLKRCLLANKCTESKRLEILWSDTWLISQKGKLRLPRLREMLREMMGEVPRLLRCVLRQLLFKLWVSVHSLVIKLVGFGQFFHEQKRIEPNRKENLTIFSCNMNRYDCMQFLFQFLHAHAHILLTESGCKMYLTLWIYCL